MQGGADEGWVLYTFLPGALRFRKGSLFKKKTTLVSKKRRPDLETLTLLLFAPVHSIYVQGGSWSTEKQKLP